MIGQNMELLDELKEAQDELEALKHRLEQFADAREREVAQLVREKVDNVRRTLAFLKWSTILSLLAAIGGWIWLAATTFSLSIEQSAVISGVVVAVWAVIAGGILYIRLE